MALKEQVVPLAVGNLGLQAGADPKEVNNKGWLKCENAVFPQEHTIGKRRGTKTIAGTHTEEFMATYKDRPVLMGSAIQALDGSPLANGTFGQAAGGLRLFEANTDPKMANPPQAGAIVNHVYNCEMVESGSVRAWVYAIYNSVGGAYDLMIESYERYSNRFIQSLTVTNPSSGNNPQCRLIVYPSDDTIHFFYISLQEIYRGEVDPTTGAIVGAAGTGVILFANDEQFDGCIVDDGVAMFVGRNNAGNGLRIATCTDAGVNTGATHAATNPTKVGIWRRFTNREACIGYFDGTNFDVRLVSYDSALVNVVADTIIDTSLIAAECENISGVNVTQDQADVVWTHDDAASQPKIYKTVVQLNPVSITSSGIIVRKSTLATKPFTVDADGFFWVTFSAERYAYLINLGGQHSGKVKAARVYGQDTTMGSPAHGATWWISSIGSATPWRTALREMLDVDANTVSPFMLTNPKKTSVDPIEANDALLIDGSLPYAFDGEQLVEQGYLHTPESFTGANSGSGPLNANFQDGDYQYRVTYRWRDRYHRLHESDPSPAVSVEAANAPNNRNAITLLPYLNHTRRSDVRVILWRTKRDGSIFYRLFDFANVVTQDTRGVYNDEVADGGLGAETLYTTGNILENVGPPQYHVHCEHQNRHFVVDDENPTTRIYYSKEMVPNISVEHSDTLAVSVPPEGGDITGIVSFMGRLIIFKEKLAYFVTGKGLNLIGSGYGYADPVLLSEAIGCVDRRTIVRTPAGIMFQGKDCIYTLSKKLSLTPVGQPVRFFTDPRTKRTGGALTLVRGVLQARRHIVVFFSSDGNALVYDWLYDKWATWTNHQATDGCEAGDLLFYKVASGNKVWVEDQTTYEDDASYYSLTLESAYLALSNLGIQVMWKLLTKGQNIDQHDLEFSAMYDEEPTWTDTQEFDATSLTYFDSAAHLGDGLSNYVGQGYSLEATLSKIECSSMRFRIRDINQGGTGESFSISSVALQAAVQPGIRRRGDGRIMAP